MADMSFSLLHCTAESSSPQQALLRDHLSVPHGHQALSPRWQMDLPVGSHHSSPRPSSTYTQTRTVDRQHNLLSNGFRLVTAGLPGWCNSSYLLQGRVQGVLPFVRLNFLHTDFDLVCQCFDFYILILLVTVLTLNCASFCLKFFVVVNSGCSYEKKTKSSSLNFRCFISSGNQTKVLLQAT